MNSLRWETSQTVPKPTVVLIRRWPAGRSLVSLRRASTAAIRPAISCAVSSRISPCSVSTRPRAWRWNKGVPTSSSSAPIWRLIADWLSPRLSAARVKLPASATPRNRRTRSQSSIGALPRRVERDRGAARSVFGQKLLGLQGGHAATAGGGHRLAEDLVLDVAGGEHARHAGRRAVGGGDHVTL